MAWQNRRIFGSSKKEETERALNVGPTIPSSDRESTFFLASSKQRIDSPHPLSGLRGPTFPSLSLSIYLSPSLSTCCTLCSIPLKFHVSQQVPFNEHRWSVSMSRDPDFPVSWTILWWAEGMLGFMSKKTDSKETSLSYKIIKRSTSIGIYFLSHKKFSIL